MRARNHKTRFRRGHTRARGAGVRMVTLIIGAFLALGCLFILRQQPGQFSSRVEVLPDPGAFSEFLPRGGIGELIQHQYYTLLYAEEYEQALWVGYELTRTRLGAPRVPRTDWFNEDRSVSTGSAVYHDYSGSGFSRGHLAPAADMAFDTTAMRESFFMSNISPQAPAFNGGIWRELEELTRDWARRSGRMIVFTGPLFYGSELLVIGRNAVAVPDAFYRVLLDPDEPEVKGIAFILPNQVSIRPVMDYAVPIDSVEALTGIDFFPLFAGALDEGLLNPDEWPVNGNRYATRVNVWNKQYENE